MTLRIRERRRRGEAKNHRYTHYDVIDDVLGVIGRLVRTNHRGWSHFEPVNPQRRDRWGRPERVYVGSMYDIERWMETGRRDIGPRRRVPR